MRFNVRLGTRIFPDTVVQGQHTDVLQSALQDTTQQLKDAQAALALQTGDAGYLLIIQMKHSFKVKLKKSILRTPEVLSITTQPLTVSSACVLYTAFPGSCIYHFRSGCMLS